MAYVILISLITVFAFRIYFYLHPYVNSDTWLRPPIFGPGSDKTYADIEENYEKINEIFKLFYISMYFRRYILEVMYVCLICVVYVEWSNTCTADPKSPFVLIASIVFIANLVFGFTVLVQLSNNTETSHHISGMGTVCADKYVIPYRANITCIILSSTIFTFFLLLFIHVTEISKKVVQ